MAGEGGRPEGRHILATQSVGVQSLTRAADDKPPTSAVVVQPLARLRLPTPSAFDIASGMGGPADSDDRVESFIVRWRASEGAERAAYVSLLEDLCRLLDVDLPDPPTSDAEAVTYRFEYPVKFRDPDGSTSTARESSSWKRSRAGRRAARRRFCRHSLRSSRPTRPSRRHAGGAAQTAPGT